MMSEVQTLSNGCSVAEIAREGERFDSTAQHRIEWSSSFKGEWTQ